MEVTAAMVKELREQTGVGMMECKAALIQAEGDMERARAILREKGLAAATKRETRTAAEGVVVCAVNASNTRGVLVEMNSETDFVARNDEFIALARSIADAAIKADFDGDTEALLGLSLGDKTVGECLDDLKVTIRENLAIGRVHSYAIEDGRVETYIHLGGKIGVMIALKAEGLADNSVLSALAHELCMQVAFSNPSYLSPEDVPAEEVKAEKEVQMQRAINDGKPQEQLERIVEGRLRAYYETVCLLEQKYIRDQKYTIKQLLSEASKKLQSTVTIACMARIAVGKG